MIRTIIKRVHKLPWVKIKSHLVLTKKKNCNSSHILSRDSTLCSYIQIKKVAGNFPDLHLKNLCFVMDAIHLKCRETWTSWNHSQSLLSNLSKMHKCPLFIITVLDFKKCFSVVKHFLNYLKCPRIMNIVVS